MIVGILSAFDYISHAIASDFSPLYVAQGVLNSGVNRDITQQYYYEIMEDVEGRWKLNIETTSPGAGLKIHASSTYSYDGTNIYFVLYSPERIEEIDGSLRVVPSNEHYSAKVVPGHVPLNFGVHVGIIWVAFVGANHVDLHSSSIKMPNITVAEPNIDPLAWICDFQYNLYNSEIRPLIKTGRFIVNDTYIRTNQSEYPNIDPLRGENEVADFENRIAIYSKIGDRYGAEYNLKGVEGTDKLSIPQRFACKVQTGVPNQYKIYLGDVTNINTKISDTTILPELRGTISVWDERLRVKDSEYWRRDVHYVLTEGDEWILNLEHPKIKGAIAEQPPKPVIINKERSFKYWVLMVLFAAVIIIPITKYAITTLRSQRLSRIASCF